MTIKPDGHCSLESAHTPAPLCADCGLRPRDERLGVAWAIPSPLICHACDNRRAREEMHVCIELLAVRSNLTWAWDESGREVPPPSLTGT